MTRNRKATVKAKETHAILTRMVIFMRSVNAPRSKSQTSIYTLCANALAKHGAIRPPDISDKLFCTQYFLLNHVATELEIYTMSKKEKKDARKNKNILPVSYIDNKNIEHHSYINSLAFLSSYEWRQVRMVALKKHGPKCQCCGATPASGAIMHVDHIKPRRHHPELALSIDNLQILCAECNHGKGSWDETDWRA